MTEDEQWSSDKLNNLSEFLLPKDLDYTHLCDLMEQMSKNAHSNTYLHDAICRFEQNPDKDLLKKIDQEGSKVFPDVAIHAFFLDKLTSAVYQDISLLEDFNENWKCALEDICIFDYYGYFAVTKYYTLNNLKCFTPPLNNGEIDKNALSLWLPFNIFEAFLADFWMTNWKNSLTGLVLASRAPGGGEDRETGGGPTSISIDADGNSYIEIKIDYPKEYADLYTLWNLAFTAINENFPYFFNTLLIPQVSGYQEQPTAHMYNRILALWIFINDELFRRINAKNSEPSMQWYSEHLRKILSDVAWGKR